MATWIPALMTCSPARFKLAKAACISELSPTPGSVLPMHRPSAIVPVVLCVSFTLILRVCHGVSACVLLMCCSDDGAALALMVVVL